MKSNKWKFKPAGAVTYAHIDCAGRKYRFVDDPVNSDGKLMAMAPELCDELRRILMVFSGESGLLYTTQTKREAIEKAKALIEKIDGVNIFTDESANGEEKTCIMISGDGVSYEKL